MKNQPSWHQRQRTVILYHETLFTVVSGGNCGIGCMRFQDIESATKNALATGGYILPPHKKEPTK